ncbi:uncharacterized protein LOC106642537 [Copidosoma floridanum]|uniref:uncharacterized protein LOC106642537 n=1 Tax=Copidosoma floridanum TaxID=29053 RepID=UPI0006C993A0|nr:uncharacterized protein LOC106642537 [Copidosoma floridanum]
MYRGAVVLVCLVVIAEAKILDFARIQNYTRWLGFGALNETDNELWSGIIKDCRKEVTFSCIQKNAYEYLDHTLLDPGNITVFDGLSLVRNNLDYDACVKSDLKSNLVEDDGGSDEGRGAKVNEEEEEEEHLSPLEEVTHALREKAIKFLATRDYRIQLPGFIGSGAGFNISPREIDERGALVRIDFDMRAIEEQQQGRLFFIKKIKKHIQQKLFTALLLIILVIKIIKFKFMFVIPFLFGVGAAKKLFLKLLLFLIPAFGHVFKLCSSYYSSHATKYHHHQHKVAHHHHHIPVPVPVPVSKPVYYDHPPPSHVYDHPPPYILDEDFQGYDYAHPHIQYRKDIEELKEWGIEPYDEPYDQLAPQPGMVYPVPAFTGTPSKLSPKISAPPHNSLPPPFLAKPSSIVDKVPPLPNSASHSLAYSAYAPSSPPRSTGIRPPPTPLPPGVVEAPFFGPQKPPAMQVNKQQQVFGGFPQQQQQSRPGHNPQLQHSASSANAALVTVPQKSKQYDDEFYGPIVERLDEIFNQLRFSEESCRERLVCSMYKNPALYAPHSNIVSNELSRDPQELRENVTSLSSQRFHRYFNAAQIGQDGGDCLRAFYCSINTE